MRRFLLENNTSHAVAIIALRCARALACMALAIAIAGSNEGFCSAPNEPRPGGGHHQPKKWDDAAVMAAGRPPEDRVRGALLPFVSSNECGLRRFLREKRQGPTDSIDLTSDDILELTGSRAAHESSRVPPPAHGSGLPAARAGLQSGSSRPAAEDDGDGGGARSPESAAPAIDAASAPLATVAPAEPVWNTRDRVLYKGPKGWIRVTVTSTSLVRGVRLYTVQGEFNPKKVSSWAAQFEELKDMPSDMGGADGEGTKITMRRPAACRSPARARRGKKEQQEEVWTPENQKRYRNARSAARASHKREMARSGEKKKAQLKSKEAFNSWKAENPDKTSTGSAHQSGARRNFDMYVSERAAEHRAAHPDMSAMQAIQMAQKDWKKIQTMAEEEVAKAMPVIKKQKISRWGAATMAPVIPRLDFRRRLKGKQGADRRGMKLGRTNVSASGEEAAAAHGTASSSLAGRPGPSHDAAGIKQGEEADPRWKAMDTNAQLLLSQLSSPTDKGPAVATGPPPAGAAAAESEPAAADAAADGADDPASEERADGAAAAHGTADGPTARAFQSLMMDSLTF